MIRILSLIFMFVFLTKVFPASSKDDTTGVNIETKPDFADIYLDGKYVGISPLRVSAISIGKHVIRMKHPLAGEIVKEIVLSKNQDTEKIFLSSEKTDLSYKPSGVSSVDFSKKPKAKTITYFYYGGLALAAITVGFLYLNKKNNETKQSIVITSRGYF
jgi:hypothetical protein